MAHQGINQSHAGLGVDGGESQGWGGRGREKGPGNAQDLPDCSGARKSIVVSFGCHYLVFLIQSCCSKSSKTSESLTHLLCYQATYDPSHGYSPQPIDISGMGLSRELQVSVFLTLQKVDQCFFCKHIKLKFCLSACSQWLSSWLRTITTPGAGRRSWSSKPRVRAFLYVD